MKATVEKIMADAPEHREHYTRWLEKICGGSESSVLRFSHSFHGRRFKGLKAVRIGRTSA
jgi:hypothetical protein